MRVVIDVRERRPVSALALDWTLQHPRELTGSELEALHREKAIEVRRAVACRLPGASWQIVEEAVDDAFFELIGRRVHRPVGWLIVTAYFRALDLLARHKREVPLEWANSHRAGLELQLWARETLRAVASLTETERDALVLNAAGYSASESASLLGTTESGVWNRVLRARRTLRAWRHSPPATQTAL